MAAEHAIHAVDPTAEVVIGGTFFHQQLIPGTIAFITEMIEAHPQILQRADAIAIHPYTQYPPRVAPEVSAGEEIAIWEMIAQVRAITGDLPILITEMGWPSWDNVTEQNQADWLVREMLLLQSEGIFDICWYTLSDDEDPSNPEQTFGLVRDDGSSKPSGVAFSGLAEKASQVERVGPVENLPEGIWGVTYDGKSSAFWGDGEVCGQVLSDTPIWIE